MSGINVLQSGDQIKFEGVLTFETSVQALELCKKRFPKNGKVIINLEKVSKIDSSALGVLTECMRRAHAKKAQMLITHAPTKLLELARVSGLDGFLPLDRTL